jgi:8-oxo-dGTP pyrophosphatase MutT (NUDIX family)
LTPSETTWPVVGSISTAADPVEPQVAARTIGTRTAVMRQSEAAVAIIRREERGQTVWLAQWNPKWGVFHLVAGHKRAEESFRECLVREIEEELHLREGPDYRVSVGDPTHLDFIEFSASHQAETRYIMELFNVELDPRAEPKVAANPENRWLTEAEVRAGQTVDGRPISGTMRRLLGEAEGKS